MKIAVLCVVDYAGNMYNLCSAVNKYTEHEAMLISLGHHVHYKYPEMMIYVNERAKSRQIIYDADAVVFKEYHYIAQRMGVELEKLKGKALAILLGGGGFRIAERRKANLDFYGKIPGIKWTVTSTDMLEEMPNAKWIPRSVRLDEIRQKYDYSKKKPPLVVASPSLGSNSKFKVERQFNQAVSALKQKGLKFQSQVIKGVDNDTCLRLKAPASIYFDRIGPIWGVNSMESGAFESAIITGCTDFNWEKLKKLGLGCPFIRVRNVNELIAEIEGLLEDEKYMRKKGLECFKYVERLHSGREAAERLVEVLNS